MPKPSGEVITGQEEYDIDKILAIKLIRGDLFYKAS